MRFLIMLYSNETSKLYYYSNYLGISHIDCNNNSYSSRILILFKNIGFDFAKDYYVTPRTRQNSHATEFAKYKKKILFIPTIIIAPLNVKP